jgi:DNA-binding transcriptional MocR family regulator
MLRQTSRLRQGMVRIISQRSTLNLKPELRIMATSDASQPKQIDLFTGWPNPGLLPPQSIKNAANDMLSDASTVPSILRYGEDEGYIELRKQIARWLSTFYKARQDIGYKRICITGGASQNLACILQTFTDPIYTRNVCK